MTPTVNDIILEWASRDAEIGGIKTKPPRVGNRIILKLFWNIAPLACENFCTLCSNGETLSSQSPASKKEKSASIIGECGKELTYRNSIIHRVVLGFVMQGGDFVFGNGSGGESIFSGKKFKDERPGLMLKHNRRGILSMGNSGKNSNTSQFFITFAPAPQCDGKHVIFGEVVSGWNVISAVEEIGSKGGTPTVPVKITACGVYQPLFTPAAGYWFDQPDDSYSGSSPVFVCRPRVAVLVPTVEIGKKFEKALGSMVTPTFVLLDRTDENERLPLAIYAENGDNAKKYIDSLLDSFAIDAVLVAPACKEYAQLNIPSAWKALRRELNISDVVIISKPLGCISALKKTWIFTMQWNSDFMDTI